MKNEIFLPGLNNQLQAFVNEYDLKGKKGVVVGSSSAPIAIVLAEQSEESISLIVEDYDSLMNSKLDVSNNDNINVALMDFEVTDFKKEELDFVYAQASISSIRRNKIVKELKRILKPGGILCVGEIVKLEENVPTFVKDIFNNSELDPFLIGSSAKYYEERDFEVLKELDFSSSMKKFYSLSSEKLIQASNELTDDEKSYYKKLLKKVSHESKAYLKQGADRYIGFKVLMLLKKV